MKTNAFSRYAPFIQKYIYQKGWDDLRDVQVEACEAILDTNGHVIIASGTASGKTEAAFFPIL
ncbi:MAG: DEAD/DEAH box helicase, partial [Lachnospira sp.]|nr:DEAD/DEAH box helicase [Lachnospira sp.]